MYAIAFDMEIAKLKTEYADPYNGAYTEIEDMLRPFGFTRTQGSVYLNMDGKANMATVYKAIDKMRKTAWFRNSVRDIRAFKVEDWSDFTDIVKAG